MEHLKLLVIDDVIKQIKKDFENQDNTAIIEMLLNLDLEILKGFLSEVD